MRRCLTTAVVTVAVSLPLPALAQNCPPGAWFCEETEVAPPPAAPKSAPKAAPPAALAPDDGDEVAPPAEPAPAPRPRPHRVPPPVVIYQPVPSAPPARVVIVTPGYAPGYYPVHPIPPPPPAPRPQWHSEWGLNLRLDGIAMGSGHHIAQNAGMGGIGMSLRYRPVPAFAFDAGVDLIGGTDYNGFQRTETPVSLNVMIFVNPRSRVQFYLIDGIQYSHAQVSSDYSTQLLQPNGSGGFGTEYSYFGGQWGAGLEFRLSRHVALDIDGLGFVRKRVDGAPTPEFIDPQTGKYTNTSGGGLFRGGVSFWW